MPTEQHLQDACFKAAEAFARQNGFDLPPWKKQRDDGVNIFYTWEAVNGDEFSIGYVKPVPMTVSW